MITVEGCLDDSCGLCCYAVGDDMAVNVCEGEVVGSRSRGGQGEEGFWTYSARLAGPADLENTSGVS